MKIFLIVRDDAGNDVMTIPGPTLPAANLTVPGVAEPNRDLTLTAFARMFGFYR
jgi:hypothetical protein